MFRKTERAELHCESFPRQSDFHSGTTRLNIGQELYLSEVLPKGRSFRWLQPNCYNNNNKNCLFDILLCLQSFCKQQHVFGDLQTTTFFFTQDWLNYYYTPSALPCLFVVLRNSLTNVFEVECSCSPFFENSIATSFLFVIVYTLLCSLTLRSRYLSLSYSYRCCWLV